MLACCETPSKLSTWRCHVSGTISACRSEEATAGGARAVATEAEAEAEAGGAKVVAAAETGRSEVGMGNSHLSLRVLMQLG